MAYRYDAYNLRCSKTNITNRQYIFRVQTWSQPSMSILKYVTKQPSRKLKDHNLEFPDVDPPTSGDFSRACTAKTD